MIDRVVPAGGVLPAAGGAEEEGGEGDWQRIPGVGVALNMPAPWGTILRTDVGKSWLPERYDSLGSTTSISMSKSCW